MSDACNLRTMKQTINMLDSECSVLIVENYLYLNSQKVKYSYLNTTPGLGMGDGKDAAWR